MRRAWVLSHSDVPPSRLPVSRRVRLHQWWFWYVRHRLYWRIAQTDRRAHGHGPLVAVMGDSLTDPYVGFALPRQHWLRHVARAGYRTLNLGVGGDTTADMCRRIDEYLSEGQPEIAVLFAGSVDAEQGIDPGEIERNVTFIVEWLGERGIRRIVLMGPGLINLPELPPYMPQVPHWPSAIEPVREILREVADQHDAVFVDLAQFHRDRLDRGQDPDFSRVRYRQSRSWHAVYGDGHFNAYGHRLVAHALLSAMAHWRLGEEDHGPPPLARPASALPFL